ncbi:MAG: Holo-[acyl-carrier-protein] synthase [Actinomycetota bacterium]|jgi:holo-[acyl-carrier protein] synthase
MATRILGVGVDLVDINRFERALARAPRLAQRLFTENEAQASTRTLAGRFAAKEALVKALGGGSGLKWNELQVSKNQAGRPVILASGQSAVTIAQAGVKRLQLSISHDGGIACAFVVAEGNDD